MDWLEIAGRLLPQSPVLALLVMLLREAKRRFDGLDRKLDDLGARVTAAERTQAVHEDRWERTDPTPVQPIRLPRPNGKGD